MLTSVHFSCCLIYSFGVILYGFQVSISHTVLYTVLASFYMTVKCQRFSCSLLYSLGIILYGFQVSVFFMQYCKQFWNHSIWLSSAYISHVEFCIVLVSYYMAVKCLHFSCRILYSFWFHFIWLSRACTSHAFLMQYSEVLVSVCMAIKSAFLMQYFVILVLLCMAFKCLYFFMQYSVVLVLFCMAIKCLYFSCSIVYSFGTILYGRKVPMFLM